MKNSEINVEINLLLSVLAKNGFVESIMVNEHIRSYVLSEFTKAHDKKLRKILE